MFKELKLIKLIIIAGLLAAILFKIDFLRLSVYQIYTDKLSYSLNDTINIFASSKAKYPIFNKTSIFSLGGKELLSIKLDLAHSKNKKEEVLLNGDKIEKNIKVKLNASIFKPGIYLIAQDIPLIVTSKEKSDVTIVYPYLNNLIHQKVEEQSVFSLNLAKTSSKRSVEVDKYTLGLKTVFKDLNRSFKANYINDIDIADFQKIKNTRVLMIYGKSNFWTPKMKLNLKTFIDAGGSVLFISSYILNNVCWYDNTNLLLFDSTRSNGIESWHGFNGDAPRYTIGTSYLYGGKSVHEDYKLLKPKHRIFKGVEELKLNAKLYNSPRVKWNDSIPIIDTNVVKFYKVNILGYNESITPINKKGIKGIFEFQPDTNSGKIISLGTEDWCLLEQPIRDKLVNNAISYLLAESNK